MNDVLSRQHRACYACAHDNLPTDEVVRKLSLSTRIRSNVSWSGDATHRRSPHIFALVRRHVPLATPGQSSHRMCADHTSVTRDRIRAVVVVSDCMPAPRSGRRVQARCDGVTADASQYPASDPVPSQSSSRSPRHGRSQDRCVGDDALRRSSRR